MLARKRIAKTTAAALLAATLIVAAGCGSQPAQSESASIPSAAASSAASASASSASAAASSASASAASESASAASSEEPNVYTNEYFGIEFNVPEGWSFVEQSTISNMNSLIATASANASLDMIAMKADQSQIVIASIEDASSATAGMTAEDYLDAQAKEIIAGLGDNYSYTSDSATVTFNGIDRELPAVIMNINAGEMHLYIAQAVAEKDGAFLNVVAMGATQDEVTSAFGNFHAIVK